MHLLFSCFISSSKARAFAMKKQTKSEEEERSLLFSSFSFSSREKKRRFSLFLSFFQPNLTENNRPRQRQERHQRRAFSIMTKRR